MAADTRRTYYDHEGAYRKIAASGGSGWDDLTPGVDQRSYDALDAFLARHRPPRPRSSVLELGCGGGQAALRLAKLGHDVVGIDYSETAILLARENARRAGVEARFVVGDVIALAESGPFDLVIDNHLLHCILGADRARVLSQVRRVLTPEGTFFSETMSCEGDFDPGRVRADPATREALNRTRFWTSRRELEAELDAAGFVVRTLELRPDDQPGVGSTIVLTAGLR